MDEHENPDEQVHVVGADGQVHTLAELKRMEELGQAQNEAYHRALKQLLHRELSDDQLEVLAALFGRLARYENPLAMVNYMEGAIDSIVAARKLAKEESEEIGLPELMESHAFVEREPGDWHCGFSLSSESGVRLECGLPREGKPHRQ